MKKSLLLGSGLLTLVLIGAGCSKVQTSNTNSPAVDSAPSSQLPASGQSDVKLIAIARHYFEIDPPVNLNGEIVSPNDQRYKQLFSVPWFATHAPEDVGYSVAGEYSVHWRYMPGCEKQLNKDTITPVWVDSKGVVCVGGYSVKVLINKDFQPESIVMYGIN